MFIIGVDYHPNFQQIAFLDQETGECGARRLRSREVLPRAEAARSQRARGDGGHRVFTLVRAVTRGTGHRSMDWRCGGDQQEARPEAKDRSTRCGTSVEAA